MLANILLEIDPTKITDSLENTVKANPQAAEELTRFDQWGFGITLVGMGVVFAALLLLYIIFQTIQWIINYKPKKIVNKDGVLETVVIPEPSGEVNAAIALAIYMNKEESAEGEDAVLKIKRVSYTYSPCISNIYGIYFIALKMFHKK
ncbi:MAG: OadG family protein [Bacteroidota bacterium]|nr:OadG family protein [Bacteroidota bacterium]